jgi:hypothetical protein
LQADRARGAKRLRDSKKEETMTRGIACAALALSAVLISATAASAASARVERACKNDYFQFCPSYEVGSAGLRSCMRQAGKRLSPRCIDALRDSGEIPRGRRR